MAIWLRSDRLLRTDSGSHGERHGGGHVGAHAESFRPPPSGR